MSQAYNDAGVFVPIREDRIVNSVGAIAAVNANVITPLNGDASVMMQLASVGSINATIEFHGSCDGTNYFPIAGYPVYQVGGSTGNPQQPLLTEVYSGVSNLYRMFEFDTRGLVSIRIRATALSSGALTVTTIASALPPKTPACREQNGIGFAVSATGVAAAAVTLTCPAISNMRLYLQRLQIIKFNTALLTAAATPVLVTSASLVGTPTFSFSAAADAQGTKEEQNFNFGDLGLPCSSPNGGFTIVAPATTGVIWRINGFYRSAMW